MLTISRPMIVGLASVLFTVLFCLTSATAQDALAFEQDSINLGLGEPPEWIQRNTPQATVESFLAAISDQKFEAAAHLLNLSEIPVSEQKSAGANLAKKLYTIIDRKVVLRWYELIDRPDGLDTRASKDAPMSGEPRRSLLVGLLDIEGRPVAIRLDRIKPENGDPVWLFSSRTVFYIPQLYEAYGPSKLERALPQILRTEAFWGLRWWEVIGLPVFLTLLWLSAISIYEILGRIAGNPKSQLVSRIVKELRLPVTIVFATFLTEIAFTDVFIVSGKINSVIDPAIWIGYVAALMMIAVSVFDAILDRIIRGTPETLAAHEATDYRAMVTRISALRRMVVLIAVAVGFGVVLTSANIFRLMGVSLLASAGVVTLILGFAGRELLGNVIASMQISLNRSARIGDQVLYKGTWCTVERINLTFVQLKIWNGNRLIVPVSDFVSESFENWSLDDISMLACVTLIVDPRADLEALRRSFHSFIASEDLIEEDEATTSQVIAQDALGISVRFAVTVPNPTDGWDIECRMREHLLKTAREQECALPAVQASAEAAA